MASALRVHGNHGCPAEDGAGGAARRLGATPAKPALLMQAAIGYQHATSAADVRIAAALEKALNPDDDQADEDDDRGDDDDGASGVLVPAG